MTDEPGESPRSGVRLDAPVLVTVEPAKTEKFAVVPRLTGGSAAAAGRIPAMRTTRATVSGMVTARAQRRRASRRRREEGSGRWMMR